VDPDHDTCDHRPERQVDVDSTERHVMNMSCSRTARMRSGDTAVAACDLEEDVF
jgi:hypothetical protein